MTSAADTRHEPELLTVSDQPYRVPIQTFETSIEIKKSHFIARLIPVESRAEALSQIALARSDYPDARHHCWAYLIGPPTQALNVAMSDDGEPSGTAGKPILNVLQHKTVGNVMVIVTRYFGGIKLGAGGLVRAYSGAAQAVFEQAQFKTREPLTTLSIACDFKDEPLIRRWLDAHQAHIIEVSYGSGALLSVGLLQKYQTALRDLLAGLKQASVMELQGKGGRGDNSIVEDA